MFLWPTTFQPVRRSPRTMSATTLTGQELHSGSVSRVPGKLSGCADCRRLKNTHSPQNCQSLDTRAARTPVILMDRRTPLSRRYDISLRSVLHSHICQSLPSSRPLPCRKFLLRNNAYRVSCKSIALSQKQWIWIRSDTTDNAVHWKRPSLGYVFPRRLTNLWLLMILPIATPSLSYSEKDARAACPSTT